MVLREYNGGQSIVSYLCRCIRLIDRLAIKPEPDLPYCETLQEQHNRHKDESMHHLQGEVCN